MTVGHDAVGWGRDPPQVTEEMAQEAGPATPPGSSRMADARVVQFERLDAIGAFAGGIAHEFNNLLTTIRGFSDLAHARLHPDDPTRRDIEMVIDSADRAASVVRALQAFAGRQAGEPVDVDAGWLVTELVPTLERLVGDDIPVIVDIAESRAWVRVDPKKLEQVLLELVTNARDSMPDGGSITIAFGHLGPAPAPGWAPDGLAAPSVRISVTDTGTGMDERTRERVFEPYFTTKPRALGTGLGMAAVFGIVTQSFGRIEVESSLGAGTTVHVDLPQVAAPGGASSSLRVLPVFKPDRARSGTVAPWP